MTEHAFTLVFRLADAGEDPQRHVDRLADAGCDDALVGVGTPGRVALAFDRRAASAEAAMHSAVRDVKRAIPDAVLAEASPDYIGLTGVAALMGFSRQHMRQLMLAHPATFPTPVHEGNPSVWHLASLLEWLQAMQVREVDPGLLAVARAARALNIARDASLLPGVVVPAPLASLVA
jgi:hypothetical protein